MANRTLDDYSYLLRTELYLMRDMNATFTSLSNLTKEFLKSSRGTVIRIEVLVVLITIMQLFLAIFGSWRRRSRNFFLQKGVLVAYTLCSSLISYTLGSMQSSAVKSSMYTLWAISLSTLFGCADSMTAYSLTDNSQPMRRIIQTVLGYSYAFLFYLSITVIQFKSPLVFVIIFLLSSLMGCASSSIFQILEAYQLASASWLLNKECADYMYQEHTMGEPPYLYDPDSMRGYHYLVDWPIGMSKLGAGTSSYVLELSRTRPDQIIDIEKVWQDNGELLLSPDLKDACLSFSLFHLLRRRFFGFECGESSQPKTHDFVFKGLLAKKKNIEGAAGEAAIINYDRVFKVIEVELDFMYDFFFTKYAAIYYSRYSLRHVGPLLTASLTVVTAFLTGLLWHSSSASYQMDHASLPVDNTKSADIGITVAILVCISVLQVVQVLYYWTTIWARVSFACQRVKGSAGCCIRLKEHLVHIGVLMSTSCWYRSEQKVGQYSLLKSVSSISNQSIVTKWLATCENSGFIDNFLCTHGGNMGAPISDDLWRAVRKPGEPTELLPSVKKAIVQSLERTQGKLTNGESSLSSNRADDLLWACKLHLGTGTSCSQKEENQACVILTWHIATCYSDKELSEGAADTEDLKEHHEVATTLSKYSAYLVGFQPKLLPGHHYDTWFVFKDVATEAVYQTVLIDSPQQEEETIYRKGLRLGEQLKSMEAARRWKVLADFWAEMLLYLAPSDNVKEHVECLAKGGELITHLWALLTHAGILTRGERNNVTNDAENPRGGPSSYTYSGTSTTQLAAPSTSGTNQPPTTSNPTVQTVGVTMVHQPANPVQNRQGAPSEATNGLSEIEEIA